MHVMTTDEERAVHAIIITTEQETSCHENWTTENFNLRFYNI